MKYYYYYSNSMGLCRYDNSDKPVPKYLQKEVHETEDEAYANFYKKTLDRLQFKLAESQRSTKNYKMQLKDLKVKYGHLQEKFPEIFV